MACYVCISLCHHAREYQLHQAIPSFSELLEEENSCIVSIWEYIVTWGHRHKKQGTIKWYSFFAEMILLLGTIGMCVQLMTLFRKIDKNDTHQRDDHYQMPHSVICFRSVLSSRGYQLSLHLTPSWMESTGELGMRMLLRTLKFADWTIVMTLATIQVRVVL